jgi:membrane protein
MKFEIQDRDIIKILNFLKIKNRKFKKVIAIIEAFISRLEKDHAFLIAAGIAFNILLYVIPLLLVALYIVNLTVGAETITTFLDKSLQNIIPENPKLKSVLTETINEVYIIFKNSSFMGWVGILTLLWLSSALLSSLRSGLNTVFDISATKIFFIYKVQDIFLIIAIALLVLILSFITPMISIAQNYIIQYFPENWASIFKKAYVILFSLFNSFLLFYLLFRFVPNKKMPRFIRAISIFSCVFFVEISRFVFSWYISGVSAYGKFYGTYAILAFMALWVYYLTFIILFSAELGKFIYDAKYDESK